MPQENIKQPDQSSVNPAEKKQLPLKKKESSFLSFIKMNPVLVAILCGMIVVVAVYFWKDIQMRKAKAEITRRADEQLLQNNHDMLKLIAEITRRADEQLLQNNHDMLKLMCKPLVWSIRSEMLRGNMEQVNVFTTDLVKEKNFQFIYLVDPSGIVIVSTDKKFEGQAAGELFDPMLLTTDSIVVLNKEKDFLTIGAPVMGFEKRLATIVFNYKPGKFDGEEVIK